MRNVFMVCGLQHKATHERTTATVTTINLRHRGRKAEMSGEREMEGGGRDKWRKRLLSDTVVVSKGRCPGATAASLLRDGPPED
ncbi:hypothetical protein NQZ68_010059 [Dissostichus eleginoides]|nr:hypothetical protein NQZ68_010059 [Dissostichus eleginoides]